MTLSAFNYPVSPSHLPSNHFIRKCVDFIHPSLADVARVSPRKIILANDEIEETLTKIINKQNHQLHTMSMEEAEKYQKEKLRHFYRRPLPPGTTATQLNLAMLGHVLPNMQPTTCPSLGAKRTFSEVVNDDINRTSDQHIIALVARSGSGKTATVIRLAKEHFVIYAVCEATNSRTPDFSDTNFRILAKDVKQMHQQLQAPVEVGGDRKKYADDVRKYDERLKSLASERVELEFLARQLFLVLLFRKNPQLTPEKFFREQINGGSTTIGGLVDGLRIYDPQTIRSMLRHVENHLQTFLNGRALVIALDEAHIAETDILHDILISPSTITNNESFLEPNGTIRQDLRRGFLTPLCATLSSMRATLVVLGTALRLTDASHVYSAVSKPDLRFEKITSFPSCDEHHVEKILGDIIDISGCEIPPKKKQQLSGRFRFTTSVVAQICNMKHPDLIKQKELDAAIDSAINEAKKAIRSAVLRLLRADRAGMIKHLFSRMVIADKLKSGKISFTQQTEFDFVNAGLCSLRQDTDGYHWVIEEPLVIEVLEEELGFDPEFLAYLDQFNVMLTNLGTNSAAKGEAFELLVYRSLQRFNGKVLADLPFVKDIKNLPEWCKTTTLNVRKFGTAKELGYDDDSTWGDVAFFEKTTGGELLIPNNLTRPDGALLLDKEHGLSLAIKLYSQPVDRNKHESNEGSSNLRDCFRTTGNKVNSQLKDQRRRFMETAFHKLEGILRIYLEFPRVSGGTPQSCVDGQDILVYIDEANMDTFFDRSIEQDSQNMDILKKMLKHTWGTK